LVNLSSPTPGADYILDWVAILDGDTPIPPTPGNTLSIDYTQLKNAVADYLGFGSTLTEAQANKVDSYIASGLRQFYYPPKMEGVEEDFEWSFMRMDGSVQTSANVGTYLLDNGVGRIAGAIYFAGDDRQMRPIPIVPVGDITALRRRGEKGAPQYAALTFSSSFGSKGQRMELELYPCPDRAYLLSFKAEADTGMINSTTRPYPLGGARFSELVLESCLAIAEQRANDTTGDHTAQFNRLLVSAVAKDRKSSASVYGQMGDRTEIPPPYGRRYVMGGMKITYHGQTW